MTGFEIRVAYTRHDPASRIPHPARTKGLLALVALTSLTLSGCSSTSPLKGPHAKRECVVMLHGLGRTKASMWLMGRHLEKQGYVVRSIGYPSRKLDAEGLIKAVEPSWDAILAENWETLHVVGHSLGGMLAWKMLSDETVPELGRMVLLAPPGTGSEVADHLAKSGFYRWVMGPVLDDLGTEPDDLPALLPPVTWETGVIAGNRSLNPWFSSMIPGPDDGKIGLSRAAVPGQIDFLVVPSSHTWMMNRSFVQEQVVHFLRNGAFHRPEMDDPAEPTP